MTNEIFTTAGCARCKIAKKYMAEANIEYQEYDFKGEGKDAFAQFYRANRQSVYRDKDGVEFPVFTDGNVVRQGVSVILGYLMAQDNLEGFIGRNILHGEWIDGFDISGGDPAQVENLTRVIAYLKDNNLKIQATTNGLNASVLEALLSKSQLDKIVMDIQAPPELYPRIFGKEITRDELMKSIQLVSTAPAYQFQTTISPLERDSGEIEYLTPEETGEIAGIIEEATGNKKHAYLLCPFDPKAASDDKFSSMEPLASSAMFKYRTAARRYQVMTEIAK